MMALVRAPKINNAIATGSSRADGPSTSNDNRDGNHNENAGGDHRGENNRHDENHNCDDGRKNENDHHFDNNKGDKEKDDKDRDRKDENDRKDDNRHSAFPLIVIFPDLPLAAVSSNEESEYCTYSLDFPTAVLTH